MMDGMMGGFMALMMGYWAVVLLLVLIVLVLAAVWLFQQIRLAPLPRPGRMGILRRRLREARQPIGGLMLASHSWLPFKLHELLLMGTSDQSQYLEYLVGVGAKIQVHALDADRASSIGDHKAHLSHTAHHAHWLIRPGEHVVGAGDLQVRVQEHRQRDSRPALQLPRAFGRVAVDDENIGPETKHIG